jgi:hypothetical protein
MAQPFNASIVARMNSAARAGTIALPAPRRSTTRPGSLGARGNAPGLKRRGIGSPPFGFLHQATLKRSQRFRSSPGPRRLARRLLPGSGRRCSHPSLAACSIRPGSHPWRGPSRPCSGCRYGRFSNPSPLALSSRLRRPPCSSCEFHAWRLSLANSAALAWRWRRLGIASQ